MEDTARTQHTATRVAHPYPPAPPTTTQAVAHPDVYVPPEFAELPAIEYAPRRALGPDPNAEASAVCEKTKTDEGAIGDDGDDGFGRDGDVEVGVQEVRTLRTPSPTPSEAQVLNNKTRMCGDWRRLLNWRRYANPRGICAFSSMLSRSIGPPCGRCGRCVYGPMLTNVGLWNWDCSDDHVGGPHLGPAHLVPCVPNEDHQLDAALCDMDARVRTSHSLCVDPCLTCKSPCDRPAPPAGGSSQSRSCSSCPSRLYVPNRP